MEKMNCNVIYDLLPVYLDGLCSEESKQIIEEHVKECEMCRKNLEDMKQNVEIPGETDVSIIKKVKRRILIEKIVIIAAIIWVMGNVIFFGGLYLMSDQVPMNDTLSREEVSVEEDANGDVWLVQNGKAVDCSYIIPDFYTTDGEVLAEFSASEFSGPEIRDLDYDGDRVLKVVLYESRLSRIVHKILGSTSIKEERTVLFNRGEKSNYSKVIFVYDEGETVLWERD